jgi:hypothetical protein
MNDDTVENVLKSLYTWETTRPDYPFVFAVHPRLWVDVASNRDNWHMIEVTVKETKFRGIPVLFVHTEGDDYFEFMDEKQATEQAKKGK